MNIDLRIQNAVVIDGSGDPPFEADIDIRDGKIVRIGKGEGPAARVLDASGRLACPGFIDSHTHGDLSILEDGGAENFLVQGVTTFVGGHCGLSRAPVADREFFELFMEGIGVDPSASWTSFGEWLDAVEARGTGANYVPLVGHHMLRGAILGPAYRRPSRPRELEAIDEELVKALDAGAFGLSSGLDGGAPGPYAAEAEWLRLLGTLNARHVLWAPHTRHHQNQWPSEGRAEAAYGCYRGPRSEVLTGRYHGLLEAVEYVRRIPGLRLMISHLTPGYIVPQPHPAFLDEALARATLEEIIDRPRAEGLEVSFNMLPCDASIASLAPIIRSFFLPSLARPAWLASLDEDGFVRQLSSRSFRRKIRSYAYSGRCKFGMLSPATDPYWSDALRVIDCRHAPYRGKTLFELARERSPHSIARALYEEAIEALCDVLAADPEATWVLIKDKREAGAWPVCLAHPFGMPCCDTAAFPLDPEGRGAVLDMGVPPVAYHMMPSFLAAMVREKGLLTLTEAVRKITSLPARVLGLEGRGLLKEGYWADVVLLDWDRLEAPYDVRRPETRPEGVEAVIVNGRLACRNGRPLPGRHGRVLRKNRPSTARSKEKNGL